MSTISTILVNITNPPCYACYRLIFAVFKTPMPNQKLWTQSAIGFLQNQDTLANGGWWQDQHILEATGEGFEKEERVAWDGWWNEHIVCPTMVTYGYC